jgi:hypothetical protein
VLRDIDILRQRANEGLTHEPPADPDSSGPIRPPLSPVSP